MRTFKITALGLLILPGVAAAAGVSGISATFTGKTSQGRPVVIRVQEGTVTPPSRLSWSSQCGGVTLSGTIRFAGVLNADGSYNPPAGHSVVTGGGRRLRITTTVRFTVSARVVHGTFTSAARVYSSGARLQGCTGRRVTFTARR